MTALLSRRRLALVAGVVALIALVLIVRAMTSARAADKPRPAAASLVGVVTTLARTQNVPVYRTGVGTVTPMASSTASPSSRART